MNDNQTGQPGVPSTVRAEVAGGSRAAALDRLVKDAAEFLAGTPLATEDARKLELRLAELGQTQWVKAVRTRRQTLDRDRATDLLRALPTATPKELFELAQSLKQYKDIGTARRILMLASKQAREDEEGEIYTKILQQAALCTYKDPDLPMDWKLSRALEILGMTESLAETEDPETLGIAGAIHKRMWEVDGQRPMLERALSYYLKGYALGLPGGVQRDVFEYLKGDADAQMNAAVDHGYTGINAAFVLDLLAAQEDAAGASAGVQSFSAEARRAQARVIRREITRSVPALLARSDKSWLASRWWFYATVGEAFFGLGEFERALEWLIDKPQRAGLRFGLDIRTPSGLDVPDWEYESTVRQLAQIARLRCQAERVKARQPGNLTEEELALTQEWRVLKALLGNSSQAVLSTFRGKFGLGLSGGGFRASLFHIGTLARLAEIDALRHVEVLSCVSGGSIVGAHYYLEVRKLLEEKPDGEITKQDYIDIVKRLETSFLAGVQRNIRVRVLAEFQTNLKMIFSARYSRTSRVGELYERELFSKVDDGHGSGPRLMKDLRVFPKLGANADGTARRDMDFKPNRDNWRRANKVPVLVLNACSLNTGHNFQFTATYMGEPPMPLQANIDCNYRLRRFYYDQQPPLTQPITLGQAVGASSCVPFLFEPMTLDGFYPDDDRRQIRLRLVDGGVCDNQGVASLLEQDCNVVLVSDGSGQMDAQDAPSSNEIGVALRSNSVLQSRVREAQYVDLAARRRAGLLRGFMFIHLKQELAGKALAWKHCPADQRHSDVYDWSYDPQAAQSVTAYSIARTTQAKLSAIRTDLDAFSDAEAYALMASGYNMTKVQFSGREPCVGGFESPPPGPWKFLAMQDAMQEGGRGQERLHKLLEAAQSTVFKAWRLLVPSWVTKTLATTVLCALLWAAVTHRAERVIPPSLADWIRDNLRFTYATTLWWTLTAVLTLVIARALTGLIGEKSTKYVMGALQWRDTLRNIGIGLAMTLVGCVVARIYLLFLDPLYLRYGRIERFSWRRDDPRGDTPD